MKKYTSILLNISWIFVFVVLQIIFSFLFHEYPSLYLIITIFDLSITVLFMISIIEINFYFLKRKDEKYRKEERRRVVMFYLISIPLSLFLYYFWGGANYVFSYFFIAGCLSLYSVAHLYALQKSNLILDICILFFLCFSVFFMPGFLLGLVIIASGFIGAGTEKEQFWLFFFYYVSAFYLCMRLFIIRYRSEIQGRLK